jgi:ERCC4-type nuclease
MTQQADNRELTLEQITNLFVDGGVRRLYVVAQFDDLSVGDYSFSRADLSALPSSSEQRK